MTIFYILNEVYSAIGRSTLNIYQNNTNIYMDLYTTTISCMQINPCIFLRSSYKLFRSSDQSIDIKISISPGRGPGYDRSCPPGTEEKKIKKKIVFFKVDNNEFF
jgi:hypothetical protein